MRSTSPCSSSPKAPRTIGCCSREPITCSPLHQSSKGSLGKRIFYLSFPSAPLVAQSVRPRGDGLKPVVGGVERDPGLRLGANPSSPGSPAEEVRLPRVQRVERGLRADAGGRCASSRKAYDRLGLHGRSRCRSSELVQPPRRARRCSRTRSPGGATLAERWTPPSDRDRPARRHVIRDPVLPGSRIDSLAARSGYEDRRRIREG